MNSIHDHHSLFSKRKCLQSYAPTLISLTLHMIVLHSITWRQSTKFLKMELLSHEKATDGDDEILTSITAGLEYFIEWCDEAIEQGNKHDNCYI